MPVGAKGSGAFGAVAGTWLARSGLLRDLVRQELVSRQLAHHLPQLRLEVLDVGAGRALRPCGSAPPGMP